MPAFPAYTRIYVCKSTILYSNTIPFEAKIIRQKLRFAQKRPHLFCVIYVLQYLCSLI